MTRLIKALCVPSIGSWLVLFAAQPLVTQHAAAQTAGDLPGDPVWIADFGLERELPSALDLVGPESGSAGTHRAVLAHRLQCWIGGVESCTFADRNDDRIREIRRFLVEGPLDRDGVLRVDFPDQTQVVVQLVRTPDLEPNDWDQPFYELTVLAESVHAPGLTSVPVHPDDLVGFAYEGTPDVRAALERLKKRIEESADTRR